MTDPGCYPPEQSQHRQRTPPPVPVLETLVTLGRTEGDEWVFIDLESLGSLSLEGDPDRAEALARSITAELMLQSLDHYVDITIAGDLATLDAAEQGTVHSPRLDQNLVDAHEQHGRDTASWIADEGFTTSTAAREPTASPATAWSSPPSSSAPTPTPSSSTASSTPPPPAAEASPSCRSHRPTRPSPRSS